MKKAAVITTIAALLTAQAAHALDPCYIETGIGYATHTADLEVDVPTEINLYCQSGNIQYGFYHTTDFLNGAPVDGDAGINMDSFMIKYRRPISSFAELFGIESKD